MVESQPSKLLVASSILVSRSIKVTVGVKAPIAQLVERQFCKLDVAGSIPARGSTLRNRYN